MYWLRIGSITLLTFRRLFRLPLRLQIRLSPSVAVVRVLVVSFFGEREIDLVALFVDHSGVVDEELECLPPGDIRAYRLQRALLFQVAAHPLGLLLESLGEALDLRVDLVVGRLRSLLAR